MAKMPKRAKIEAETMAKIARAAHLADALASELGALGFKVHVTVSVGAENTTYAGQLLAKVEAVKPLANAVEVLWADGEFQPMWSYGFRGGECSTLASADHARYFARTLKGSW